jgi:hypothetical protein
MIKNTVALPVWNSVKIAWLCLESLCNQHKPNDGWELIICEEAQANYLGKEFFMGYQDRLKLVGCEKITCMEIREKTPLSIKWVKMSYIAAPTSQYFLLCAADNYYHPWMLQDIEKNMPPAEWFITTQGYFYDVNLKKLIQYKHLGSIGLQMAAKTSLVQRMPLEIKNRGVDGWFFKNLHPAKIVRDPSDHWKFTLCTNGLNNISKSRHIFFTNPHGPFYNTTEVLQNIVPEDIYKRMMLL